MNSRVCEAMKKASHNIIKFVLKGSDCTTDTHTHTHTHTHSHSHSLTKTDTHDYCITYRLNAGSRKMQEAGKCRTNAYNKREVNNA